MSKILAKLVKKGVLLSIILAVIVAAAAVVTLLCGINDMANISSGKKVVVTIDPVLYNTETAKEEIEAACDGAFKGNLYVIKGDNGNDGTLVYAFKSGEDVSAAVAQLKATFADWTKDDGKYATHSLTIAVTNESVMAKYAEGYFLRAAIAGVVLVVLAFAYVALRYNWRMGLVAAIAPVASVFITGALVVLTRIPTSASIMYALMTSAVVAVITVLFNLNKLRTALKSEEASKDVEELIVSSVAVKETAILTAVLGVAVLLVGIPAGAAWFALSAFIGVVAAAFVGLIYAPAICLPMQKAIVAQAASATKSGYKGAKKAEKSAPAVEVKKEEVAPVAEAKEEPVEEAPAEETVEEAVEEAVEEEEAPAEEAFEEVETADEADAE